MAKVPCYVYATQQLALVLLCSFFMFQAYTIFTNQEKWASSFYSAYGNFEEWWNKSFKRYLWQEFAYSLPPQREMYPFKYKATIVMGYMYGIASILLVIGERYATLILIVPHVIYSLFVNAPSSATTFTTFNL